MNDWQRFCLAELQLDRWVEREKRLEPMQIYLGRDRCLPLSLPEKKLLDAMLSVKGWSMEQVRLVNKPEQIRPHAAVWIMGEDNALDIAPQQVKLKTKSLHELLGEPKYKKQVYEALLVS